MTLAATTPINSYVGTGAANVYPFTFTVFTQSQLLVSVASPDGSGFVLTLGEDYTVAGLSPSGTPASVGSITLVNNGQEWLEANGCLIGGWDITIQRNVPLAQTASIRNQGDFYQEYLENALDYAMMCIQQVGNNGLTLTDTVTGYTYQLVMVDGVLSTQRIT